MSISEQEGALGFSVLRYWLFLRSVFRFFVPENFCFSVVAFIVCDGFSVFLTVGFSISIKNFNGFSDLVSDVVFGFSYLGSGFTSI